jgi:transposase InsO family protein
VVGTPIIRRPPRTDPSERNYRTVLLPRVVTRRRFVVSVPAQFASVRRRRRHWPCRDFSLRVRLGLAILTPTQCPVLGLLERISLGQDAWLTLSAARGRPTSIRVDNGPAFISKSLDLWVYWNGVTLDFSRPASRPTMRLLNHLMERFVRNA